MSNSYSDSQEHFGYKVAKCDLDNLSEPCIVKLKILGINNENRQIHIEENQNHVKYRCSVAKVVNIWNPDTGELHNVAWSHGYSSRGLRRRS